MQLGIEGDGVTAIFKGLQLDVGAPHLYLDFQFEVVDEPRPEAHLASIVRMSSVASFAFRPRHGAPPPVA